jgi:hypothetical protein
LKKRREKVVDLSIGKCALCGAEGKLTFEHLPPRKAFNWFPAKVITGDQIFELLGDERTPWDADGIHYLPQQRGTGAYSLCESCNNSTGTWYANDYVKFANIFHEIILDLKPIAGNMIETTINQIRPLHIYKQVLSIFCSINHQFMDGEDFSIIRSFVNSKECMDFDTQRFKVLMYVFIDGNPKMLPLSIKMNHSRDFKIVKSLALSEFAHYPLGFQLLIDPPKESVFQATDISLFIENGYKEASDIFMRVPVYESHIAFPDDFRSKAEILDCKAENNNIVTQLENEDQTRHE